MHLLPRYYLFLVIQNFFIGVPFWTNVIDGIKDRNATVFLFCILNLEY